MTALATNCRLVKDGEVESIVSPEMCSGYGQLHSTQNKLYPQPYVSITLEGLADMLVHPQQVEKDKAQWLIASTLKSRSANEQRLHGEYWAIWGETDEPKTDLYLMVDNLISNLGVIELIAYTTKSATEDKQKSRFILPLQTSVDGLTYELMQKAFNQKLIDCNIEPDRANETANQVCYLPNKGQFYRSKFVQGLRLQVVDWQDNIDDLLVENKHQQETVVKQKQQATQRRIERISLGNISPIETFNRSFSVEQLFSQYGYIKRGSRWLSPNSQSASPAVQITVEGNRWMSAHQSDVDLQLGKPNDSGKVSGDAFDLFIFYEHGNDRTAALKALGSAFTTADGTILSTANQRNCMQQAAADGVMSSAVAITSGAIPFSLNVFSLNGQSKEMRAKMLDDKFVLGRLAILGQSTAIFAKPNGGKTLLAIWLLIEQIKSGDIDGNDVYYINADDNHKGITQKLELAEQHGFIMLAPGYHGFKADQLSVYLDRLIQSDQARAKVIILDTVKKFTDIMDKREGSKFGEAIRQFVAHGGTVIMLAHTNKHRDGDGKLVFSGTSDLVDDCDCAYLLDTISDDGSPKRVVEFENIKSRGDVASKSGYSFDSSDGKSYKQRLESVSPVADKEREAAEHRRILDEQLERDKDAIHTIRECLIAQDKMKKTELIKAATERSAISKIKLTKALHRYTGVNKAEHQYWRVDVKDKNAHIYCLNGGGTEKQGHT